ncbi:MAG: T9SS type A sorting domain-containing protein [Cyclonatronaceae bacterium]
MKKIYQAILCGLFVFALGFSTAYAQIPRITIKDLNTYEVMPEDILELREHPMVDSLVEFTAMVSSYPRNSGLASYDPEEDAIGRIHVFVIDTTAYSQGRDGMGMQLVVDGPGLNTLENLERGDIITVRGLLTFFGDVAQFNTDDIISEGDVWNDPDFEKYQELLEPWTISLSELNEMVDGGVSLRFDTYTKYHAQYVRIEEAVIQNRDLTSLRPWMYIGQDGVIAYNRDTSLRYRNDRTAGYRTGYNFRRNTEIGPQPPPGQEEDGFYEPPPPGAVINYGGYVVVNTFDPDALETDNSASFAIVAMEDGVRWLGLDDDAIRYTNENLPVFYPYEIPNDLEIIGFPPIISGYTISNLTPTSDEAVEISFSVAPATDDATIESVVLTYMVEGEATDVELTGSNGNYDYTFPTFPDLTSVGFEIRAMDSNGITGTLRDGDILDGNAVDLRFFVLDSAVESIESITRTSDGMRGPSPLFGLGELPVDITAVVVADSADGFIVVHDGTEAWSGVFLEPNDETQSLRRGDRIQLASTEVGNTNTNNNFANITYLVNPEFSVLESGVDYEQYIPVLTTNDLAGQDHRGAPYEAMVIRFEDVHVATNQADAPGSDFGEWAFASGSPDDENPSVRVRYNVAQNSLRVLENFSANYNDHIKTGALLEHIQGVYGYNFGNPKMTMRNDDDVAPVEDMFFPDRVFPLFLPANNAQFTVSRNLEAEWASTSDRDGDDVIYLFALSTPDDETFEEPLLMLPSLSDGASNQAIIRYADLDDALEAQGLDVGESDDFIWTVLVSDGRDTVQVSTKTGPDFNPVSRSITLERAEQTSVDDSDLPQRFALEQNYPNPFNPTTQIRYDVPNQSHVRIMIYDVLGRQVQMLVNEEMSPGRHNVDFDATQLASGVYIYRMEAGPFVQTRKMMLVK